MDNMGGIEMLVSERLGPDIAPASERQARSASHRFTLLPLALLGLGDAAIIVGTFSLAYWARFVAADDTASALGFESYVGLALLVAAASMLLFALRGLYEPGWSAEPWGDGAYTIASSLSIAELATLVGAILLGDYRFSRLWLAEGWLFAIVGVVAWRSVLRLVLLRRQRVTGRQRRALIIGSGALSVDIAGDLEAEHRVIGYVDDAGGPGRPALPLLGPVSELEWIVGAYRIDDIVISASAIRREDLRTALVRGFGRAVTIQLLPDLGELMPERVAIRQRGGRSYIGFRPVARVSWLKRASDVLIAGLILLGLAPLLALLALAIKLDSRGPILYRQLRVGKDGRHFWMLKFRSMCQDAERQLEQVRRLNEASGPLFKIKADPRVTRVGRIMRRYSLDEFPQLINVLKGEMSLVGPRPPLPSEVEQYEEWQYGRLRAVPGMTGLWQVSGRSEISFQEMVRLDLHYVRNWSLGLDMSILVRTIPAVFTNRGAY